MRTRARCTLGVTATTASLVMLLSGATPVLASQPDGHSRPSTPQPAFTATSDGSGRATTRAGAPAANACYSQRDNDNGVGIDSQLFEDDNAADDNRAADDFTLNTACTVGDVQVDGLYFNGPGPAPTVNVTFYQDDAGTPSDVVSNQPNLTYTDPGATGTFDIAINPTPLDPGTYWVSVQVNMPYSSNGEWAWSTNNTQRGNPAVWQNPGDGFGTGCTAYETMTTCIPDGEGPDLSFALLPAGGDPVSRQFGGYVVNLPKGKLAAIKNTGSTADPSNPCTDLADGTQVSFTNSVELLDAHGIDHEISVLRQGVCAARQVTWSYWWNTTDDGSAPQFGRFALSVAANDTVRTTFSAKNASVIATVNDLTTGMTEQHITHPYDKASPILCRFGVSGTGPDGQPYDLGGFANQTFSKVIAEGKSIAGLDPTNVTLVDSGGNPLYNVFPFRGGHFVIHWIAIVTDTFQWNGWNYITGWGCPNDTTFGEVITIPSSQSHIDSFNFFLKQENPGSLVLRGELYKWDGQKATGPALYESAPVPFSGPIGSYQSVQFTTPATTVTPGAQYVIFASIDKDYEQCSGFVSVSWGFVPDNSYSGGTFVWQANGGNEALWTQQPWGTNNVDTVFSVTMH